jgi:carbon storage regulator CsrA
MALWLDRKPGETVQLGGVIDVTVAVISGGQVRLTVDAPECVSIVKVDARGQIERPEDRVASPSLKQSPAYVAPWALLDNVAAISAEFHRHSKYDEFYDTFGAKLAGFPGIWDFCAQLGVYATEAQLAIKKQDSYEWLDVVLDIVSSVIATSLMEGKIPDNEGLRTLIKNSFARATYETTT